MCDSKVILFASGFELSAPPIALWGWISLELKSLLNGFAFARIKDKFRHAAAVPNILRLVGRHIVANAVFRLAGGVTLEETGAAIFQSIEDSFVKLGSIGHGNLGHIR